MRGTEPSGRVAITARIASLHIFCLFGEASMHAFMLNNPSFQRAIIPSPLVDPPPYPPFPLRWPYSSAMASLCL